MMRAAVSSDTPKVWHPDPQDWDIAETLSFLSTYYSGERVYPGCETCMAPPKDVHGRWSQTASGVYAAGSVASLTCNPGFAPSRDEEEETEQAAAEMTCGKGGLWEFWGSLAKCVGTPGETPLDASATCLEPPGDPAGMWVHFYSPFDPPESASSVAHGYKIGDKAMLECDLGFVASRDEDESEEAATVMTCGLGVRCLWSNPRASTAV